MSIIFVFASIFYLDIGILRQINNSFYRYFCSFLCLTTNMIAMAKDIMHKIVN